MVDWLSELLYLHDVENLLFKRFHVESVGEKGLKARVNGEFFQEGVHVIKTGVKAARPDARVLETFIGTL